ncbi:MAG: DUF721 domain-containing protein [Candidatus Heimdallarchaeota archaeon]|nr:DUF721 domain-containing protein [Candidatus Heimdallarchaeota archaeon]
MIKKSNESTLGEVIKELLKTYHLDDKLMETKLINSWSGVVGRMIDKHTVKLYVKKKVLFVKMDSAAITNELSYAKEKIINALNKEAGMDLINEMRFI